MTASSSDVAAVLQPYEFSCRIASSARERAAYFELRRSIFCREQNLFMDDDRDACDRHAYPIVCLAERPGDERRVVGVVRLWEESPGEWWGGRLGVQADFRTAGVVGRRLVQTAVGIARGWQATRFRATVQRANVAFFRRLRWRTLEEIELCGQPHHLMEAALEAYPAIPAERVGGRHDTDASAAADAADAAAALGASFTSRDAA